MTSSTRLRQRRGKLDLENVVRYGPSNLGEIVYGYRFPSFPDRIKIGYSSRGLARIKEQSTAFPEIPRVEFLIHHKNAARIEEELHLALAGRQANVMGVEWFHASFDDIVRVSPHLRRALGLHRRDRILRHAMTGLGAVMGLLLIPVVVMIMTSMLSNLPPSEMEAVITTYLGAIAALDVSRTMQEVQSSIGYLVADGAPWPIRIGATIALLSPTLILRRLGPKS